MCIGEGGVAGVVLVQKSDVIRSSFVLRFVVVRRRLESEFRKGSGLHQYRFRDGAGEPPALESKEDIRYSSFRAP